MATDEANQVWKAFAKYAQSQDESAIVQFTREQIESTLVQFTNQVDRNAAAYRSMELQIEKIKEQKTQQQASRKIWKDRGITFVLGILSGLLLAFLIKKFGFN